MSSTRPTVVVVDDDPIILEQARSALEGAGYRVLTRSRAIGCVALTLQDEPDVLLLDVGMPGVEGDTLVKLLMVASPQRRTTVLLYSSMRESELKARVDACGADGYICKTTDPKILVRQVRQWVSARLAQNVNNPPNGSASPSISAAPSSHRAAADRAHVLFVDDDMMMLSSYRRIVQQEDMDAEFALSGTQALKWILSAEPPEVVVCDLMMPEPNGEAVYATALQQSPTWASRFVFVTGFKEAEHQLRRTFHGHVLRKPVAASDLIRVVRSAIGIARSAELAAVND